MNAHGSGAPSDGDLIPDEVGFGIGRRILTYGLSMEELDQLRRYEAANYELVIVNDVASLIERIASGACKLAVLDSASLSDSAMRECATAAHLRGLPLLLVIRLTQRAARHVLTCAATQLSLAVAVRGIDSIERGVETLVDNKRPTDALLQIAQRLPAAWAQPNRGLATEAALVGRRVCSVPEWAVMRKTSVRTLERQISRAFRVTPTRLLAWMLFLHTAWRIDELGWSPKRAATESGASSPYELRRRFQRTVPANSALPLRHLSFPDACDAFAGFLG